jgi:hypothetical protein
MFGTLGICRDIQERTNISIKKFVIRLGILRATVIEIARQENIAKLAIDIETQEFVKMLQ